MRKWIASLGVGALVVTVGAGAIVAPGATAAQEPKNHQRWDNARKIAKWDRIWFRGAGPVGGTDIVQPFSPPTAAEMRATAPAATALGVINIGWFVGDFPALPAIPPYIPAPTPEVKGVDVPKDFADHGYEAYIWYSTLTGGDSAAGAPKFLGLIQVPGWNAVTDVSDPPRWIATDHTTDYQAWAGTKGDAPLLVAHRGGGVPGQQTDPYPENSIAAFTRAIADGAAILETDVQWTKPEPGAKTGVPVLLHDETINRTLTCKPSATGCTDPVYPNPTPAQQVKLGSLTKAQLDRYQLSNGESVPTLAAFLKLAAQHKVGVLPEIKNWLRHAAQMRPELRSYTREILAKRRIPTTIIGSFDPTILQYFEDQGFLAKQVAKCARLPKQLRADSRVLLRHAKCTTSAGSKVHVYLKAKKRVATLQHSNGKVFLKVKDNPGRIRLTLRAHNARGYDVYKLQERYRIR